MRLVVHVMTGVIAVTLAAVALGEPEVFSKAGYDADRAAAIEQERLHLVYATATWCPPCQRMKTTTWVDKSVESWVEQHGIVTALDVDDFPKIAQDLGVRAMPTMILFEGDEELGRTVGYQSAADLVAWMEAGRKGEDFVRARADAPVDGVRGKLDRAREMKRRGEFVAAAQAYADLWDTMLDEEPSMVGVRLSFMVRDMTEVAQADDEASGIFRKIKDREQAKINAGTATDDDIRDWMHLNQIVGSQTDTIAWAEEAAATDTGRETVRRFGRDVAEAAILAQRWDLVTIAIDDPVATAERWADILDQGDRIAGGRTMDRPMRLLNPMRPSIIAALHADDDGVKERALIRFFEKQYPDDDGWKAVFAAVAAQCGKLREDHSEWLNESEGTH